MKIEGNEIKIGNILHYKNRLWAVTKTQHVQPGKGGAYMQVEMKELRDGTKLNERFRSAETVERVFLEERPHQFLFQDGNILTFMDNQTFDQVSADLKILGDSRQFLKDNMTVQLSFFEGDIVGITLPETVVLEVIEADPVIKGQTASASYKPAKLENGMRLMVPPHITVGTKIVVHTQTQEYIERAN